MQAYILTLNPGSSSIKIGLFQSNGTEVVEPIIIDLHNLKRHFIWKVEGRDLDVDGTSPESIAVSLNKGLSAVGVVESIAIRVVHGGADSRRGIILDQHEIDRLSALSSLAPLHQPAALEMIRVMSQAFPDARLVACPDTAFHHTADPLFSTYALPLEYRDEGLRAYGFHGISYASVLAHLKISDPALSERRLLLAHLGSGASLCLVNKGKSIASSMGFSALEGLPMSTRCGQIDAGLVLHLVKRFNGDASQVENLLYRQSGLLGLSGISGDMRALLASDRDEARFAVQFFIHQCARQAAGMMVLTGGIDGLIFTGGIGENSEYVREQICGHLQWLLPHDCHIGVITCKEEQEMADIVAAY
ncbi:MAG: acetate kinase [Alcanivoracaceae bacterium]|jgi:acetate kinase|nr:acetate kinase [Alcanivoracaceae bacterium]